MPVDIMGQNRFHLLVNRYERYIFVKSSLYSKGEQRQEAVIQRSTATGIFSNFGHVENYLQIEVNLKIIAY